MNAPNLITIARLLITAACFVVIEMLDPAAPDSTLAWWGFGLFVLASSTDFVDGWLARRLGAVTVLGRILDPFADKVLVCGVLVLLLQFPAATVLLDAWFVVVILVREFLVTTIRGVAEAQGVAFPAESIGKWKMVLQCVMAAGLLTMVAGVDTVEIVRVLYWATLGLTVASGVQYSVRARRLLSGA